MKIFKLKLIKIDLEKERIRINYKNGVGVYRYNKRQRKVLLKLVDLFDAGDWQACLDWVNDKKNFPYNEKEEYDEKEHIGIEISDILYGVGYDNYYTSEQLFANNSTGTNF